MEQPPDNILPFDGDGVLVSVDVANVGVLWTRDPEFTWGALNQLERLLETMVEDMGGELQPHPSDAFIIRFRTPESAVMWCARMQEGLLALDWPDALAGTPDEVGVQEMLFGGLMARMVIHAGPIAELHALAGLAHPGQVLVSGPTFDKIRAPIPPDLRVESLGIVNATHAPVEVRQVTTRLLSRRRFPALAKQTSGLPFAPNCFVGRQADLADLRARFRSGARMVNITSQDGLGKTRLAMHLARLVEPITRGGAALVHLSATTDTTDLMLATASSLGLSLGQNSAGSLVDRIGHAIAARGECVLVFDEFGDHLDLNALLAWVRLASDAKFLITSTEPLATELSTHMSLDPLSESDARSMFLARTHRKLRSQERSIHARQVALPDPLPRNPSTLEDLTGFETPRWREPSAPALHLRQQAQDPDEPLERRIEATLNAARLMTRMGMPDEACSLLNAHEKLFAEQRIPWVAAKAFALIRCEHLADAHALLDPADTDPTIELMRGHLAFAEDRHQDAVDFVSPFESSAPHALLHGKALARLDEWEDAVAHLEVAAEGAEDSLERAWALATLGRVHQDLGHAAVAAECLTRALHCGGDDVHLTAQVYRHRFEGASAALQMDEARGHLERSLASLNRCGDRAGTASALIDIAVLDLIQRYPRLAQQHLDRALQICRVDGLTVLEARTLMTAGIAHRSSGDTASALDAFVEAAALAESDHALLGMIMAHHGAAEAAVDAIDNAVHAFSDATIHLSEGWDMLANTMHDMLLGFVDLARAREAALGSEDDPNAHIAAALERLARGSSFETRSTPPRGRERPSRINEFRLARLMLDNAIASLGPSTSDPSRN